MKVRFAWVLTLSVLLGHAAASADAAAAALPAAVGTSATPNPAAPAVEALYARHCAACHAPNRLGAMGPALLPDNLARLRQSEAVKVITEGRVATQMPAFGTQLGKDEIAALANWIYTPVVPEPRWSDADMAASRIEYVDAARLPARPVFKADPLNLFLVVEAGDHHVSVLDGDTLIPIHRFQSRFALHGGPKFAAGGRYVFFGSRDGWITKYDLWNLVVVAEIRAGINTRNVAVSPDGSHVAVANYLPHNIVLLDGDLRPLKTIEARARDGSATSRVSAVYEATPRQSFIAALKDVPEVWEISYSKQAGDIPTGFIHDYKQREGSFIPGYLNPRRTVLDEPLDDFFFTQDYAELMGASRDGVGQVVNLDVRRKIADLPLAGMPHLGSGITWTWRDPAAGPGAKERTVMASTNLKTGEVTVIDMKTWEVIRRIPTRGPGFFLRSHAASRYAFVDSMMAPAAKHVLQVIDKDSLTVVKEIVGEPGKTLAHIEFTRDGRYALASLWEDEGAVIVYDATTLEEVKRLPMRKPVGKYNVWNKLTREEGTSH